MKKILLPMAVFLAVAVQEGSAAGWLTGNQLVEKCLAKDMECKGYIQGVDDMLEIEPGLTRCTPPGATMEQHRKVVLKYADDNPEYLHYPASVIVNNALIEAFPCA